MEIFSKTPTFTEIFSKIGYLRKISRKYGHLRNFFFRKHRHLRKFSRKYRHNYGNVLENTDIYGNSMSYRGLVGIATRLQAGHSCVRIPTGVKDFFVLHQNTRTLFWAHTSAIQWVPQLFPWG